jgi:hypothetical protein
MREFRNAWKSFRGKKEKEMTGSERVMFDKLQTEPQREAFLLCRSFATLKKEFPLPQSSLADRIGLTQQGAGYVIARLIKVGAIRKTANAKTNRKSAYYRWNAHLPRVRDRGPWRMTRVLLKPKRLSDACGDSYVPCARLSTLSHACESLRAERKQCALSVA